MRGRFIGIKQYFRGRNSDRKGAKSHAVRRVRQTSKSGQSGAWGRGSPVATAGGRRQPAAPTEATAETPNERIGKSQRDIPIHCSPMVSRIQDTPLCYLNAPQKTVFTSVL